MKVLRLCHSCFFKVGFVNVPAMKFQTFYEKNHYHNNTFNSLHGSRSDKCFVKPFVTNLFSPKLIQYCDLVLNNFVSECTDDSLTA